MVQKQHDEMGKKRQLREEIEHTNRKLGITS